MINSTFKIYCKGIKLDYTRPWQSGISTGGTGSGFGVNLKMHGKEKYILTNAHVVEKEEPFIQVSKWSSSKKYDAKIINISPEVDMALLEVMDSEFWSDVPVMQLGQAPAKGEEVVAVGFPKGGYNASITKGIVSRIFPIMYSDPIKNISIQIDAAINPGNSGGPVFDSTGKNIVGIAFITRTDAQNMCYMIPEFIIKHYLNGMADGGYNGVCDLGIKVLRLENSVLQSQFLKGEKTGVLITRVDPSNLILKPNDVLHAIDGIPIQNDGNITIDEHYEIIEKDSVGVCAEKIPYWHIIRMKYPGDKVELSITRDGKFKNIQMTLGIGPNSLIPGTPKYISKEYVNLNGFMFQPANLYHLDQDFSNPYKYLLRVQAERVYKEFENQEIVILSEIMPNKTTENYRKKYIPVISVNGTSVRNLEHFKKLTSGKGNIIVLEKDVVIVT